MENGKQPINSTLTYNQSTGTPNGHLLGLTKREYFAGLAMQGFLASKIIEKRSVTDIISASVELADRLLKQLEDGK